MIIKTKNWDLRNVEALQSGELCVRQAFDNSLSGTTPFTAATKVFGGFTVKHPTNDSVWHYAVVLDTTVKLYVLDEYLVELFSYDYGVSVAPMDVTHSIVEDEIIVACPGLPTLWGVVGSGLIVAAKVDSVNPATTALDIPQGLCVSWAGRTVISPGDALYFSDALYPRTYVAENILNPPGGTVYGLHVNKGGALIIVTSSGVWALPEDAAASGQLVIGIWSKLTDYACAGFRNSCCAVGRVFGLTDGGYRLIDDAQADTIALDESMVSRSSPGRITFADYRQGWIFGGQNGVYVVIGKYLHYSDMSSEYQSWITTSYSTGFVVTALLSEQDGNEMFLMDMGAGVNRFFVRNGNARAVDGTDTMYGSIAGRMGGSPAGSPVIRRVSFNVNTYKVAMVRVLDTQKSVTPIAYAPIIGTSSWGSGTYEENRLRSVKVPMAIRGDDLGFEVQLQHYPALIPNVIDIDIKGPGKGRV